MKVLSHDLDKEGTASTRRNAPEASAQGERTAAHPSSVTGLLLHMQRTVGNAAVSRFLQRQFGLSVPRTRQADELTESARQAGDPYPATREIGAAPTALSTAPVQRLPGGADPLQQGVVVQREGERDEINEALEGEGITITQHGVDRALQRGLSAQQIINSVTRGAIFDDPLHDSVVYRLGGICVMVVDGNITTVMRSRIMSRWLPR